jgi:hypothetical protein
MVTFVEQNLIKYIFPMQVPRANLRFEVLFKEFHPRVNLTTIFLTKTYLLNTIKLFSDHKNRSLGPKQQNFEKPILTLRNLNFKILSMQDTELAQMRPGAILSAF